METVREIMLSDYEPGSKQTLWLTTLDELELETRIPVIILQGRKAGPVVGVTAALHGDEVTGIVVINKLLEYLEVNHNPLAEGTLIVVPGLNHFGVRHNQREFLDGVDLNHIMPGNIAGTPSEQYAYAIIQKLVTHMDVLIDLHTGRMGQENLFYIKANSTVASSLELAKQFPVQVIQDTKSPKTTLRGVAESMDKAAITIEMGAGNIVAEEYIQPCIEGILNVLEQKNMIHNSKQRKDKNKAFSGIIAKTFRILAQEDGLIEFFVSPGDHVKKNQLLARQKNLFGKIVAEYKAQEKGIIIGKHFIPYHKRRSRILHIAKL